MEQKRLRGRPPAAGRVSQKQIWPDREVCPTCGRVSAKVFGRSESHAIVYLKCTECGRVAIAQA